MSRAREEFFRSIEVIRRLAGEPLLTDTFPPSSIHNVGARTLRNGLTVSAFTALESYLEDALEERVTELSKASLKYNTFNDPLRRFFTMEALQGLVTRAGFVDEADRLQFVETSLPKLARFQLSRPNYTALGFSPKGSNIGESDILSLLKAFGVNGGWNTLAAACASFGVQPISLPQSFKNFARARNKAAHDSSHNVTTSDLLAHLETALFVGIAVDVVSANAIRAYTSSTTVAQAVQAANAANIDFRFLDPAANGAWAESHRGQVLRTYRDLSSARSGATKRRPRVPILVRDARLFPLELL